MKINRLDFMEIMIAVVTIIVILLLDRASKKKYHKLDESVHSKKE